MHFRAHHYCLVACALLGTLTWIGCNRDPAAQEARYLARGKNYLAKKDYARALLEFRNAGKAVPKDAEPLYQAALAYLDSKQAALALNALQQAVKLNPKHTGAQLKLSEMMLQSRQPAVVANAAGRLNDILAARPDDPEALDALALADIKLKKPDDAEKLLRQALEKFPAHVQSSAALASMQFAKGDFPGAEQTLKTAISKAPKSAEALLALAQLYILERNNAAAEEQLQRVLQIDARNVRALLNLGSLQLADKNAAAADQTYRTLAAIPGGDLSYIHAAFLYSQGKQAEGLQELEKLGAAHPGDRAMRMRLVSAYFAAGRTQDATRYLADILKKNPKDTDALMLRSRVHLNAGELNEAEQDLQAVQHFLPNSPDVHYGLSRVYALRGLERSRLKELEEVLRINPNLVAVRAELAKAQIAGGQAQVALQMLDGLPAQQKSTLALLTARNWALLALNRADEVQAALEPALRTQKPPELLIQRGVARGMKKEYSGARQDAEEVLRTTPGNTGALNLAVEVSLELKDQPGALRILQETAARNPRAPQVLLLVGQWQQRLGKTAEARQTFESAKALNPRLIAADLNLAALDTQEGKTDSARNTLSAILKTEPKNSGARLMLASLEYNNKNIPAALTNFQVVVDQNPDNIVALNGAAYLVARQDPAAALKMAQHALELAPQNPAVQDTLGWIYYRKGLYSRAVELLSQAVTQQPTPVRQYHLALSYMKVGDNVHASQYMQAALAKDPKVAESEGR